jgi:hypothetical protein
LIENMSLNSQQFTTRNNSVNEIQASLLQFWYIIAPI